MRTSLWMAVAIAIASSGLGGAVAIGQEVEQGGYYLPDGTPCGSDGSPLARAAVMATATATLAAWFITGRIFPPVKGNRNAEYRSMTKPWHGSFYDPSYGTPIALVVPPTAERQTNYGWGVGNTRVSRIDAQFMLPYPGPGAAAASGYGFAPTPPWPSDTNQFGVYYVRGPW